jgi:hypothetical protein
MSSPPPAPEVTEEMRREARQILNRSDCVKSRCGLLAACACEHTIAVALAFFSSKAAEEMRERCVEIAESLRQGSVMFDAPAYAGAARQILEKIRSLPTTPEKAPE